MEENVYALKGKISNLAKDTGLFALSNFGSKILLFLLTPLYTSILTTEEFGIADIITTTINFIYPILTLAISESTLRFALDKNKDSIKVLSTSMCFINISVIIMFLFTPIILNGNYLIAKYWWIFFAIYTLFNYHNCLSNYAKATGKTTLFAVQGIAMTLSVILSNILLLVVFKTNVIGYLISIIIGYITPIILMVVKLKIPSLKGIFICDKALLKEMLKYSLPMVPTLLSWAINSSIDKYMIIGFVGLGASGLYSVAHKIPSIFTTVLAIFSQAWQLSAIESHGEKTESEYHSLIYKYLDYISVVGCIFILILTKPLASVLFSNDYYAAWKLVPLLTVAAMFSSHAGFLAGAFRAAKKTNGLFYSVVAAAVCNVILNAALIPTIGTLGAACATATSFFINWLIRMIMVKKLINIKIDVAKTVITYILFITSVVTVTLEIKFSALTSVVILILVIILHIKETKEICILLYKTAWKILKRRKL